MNRLLTKWTEQEDTILKLYYPLETQEIICSKIPNRSWKSIMKHASDLNIKKQITSRNINGDIGKLLQDTPEAYYWMGFLLADGTFDGNGRLCLTLAEKDSCQVYTFAKFMTAPIDKVKIATRLTNISTCKTYRLACSSSYYEPQLRKKFDLQLNKTKNPPTISNYVVSNELLLCLLIGYIDGDGCVDKHKQQVKITVHSSWLHNLKTFKHLLENEYNRSVSNPNINKAGYAFWSINKTVSKLLKIKAKQLDLPSMARKWDLL